ncbi:hypothetical protein IKQ21_09845 [bacterium]|nr:hypothetical protein [bacterium]
MIKQFSQKVILCFFDNFLKITSQLKIELLYNQKKVKYLFLVVWFFCVLTAPTLSEETTYQIPDYVIKFANRHHCTNVKPWYESKKKQRYNKEYDIYCADFKKKSRSFECIILAKKSHVRFANVSESLSIIMNCKPLCKFKGTHPIKEWFFIHFIMY